MQGSIHFGYFGSFQMSCYVLSVPQTGEGSEAERCPETRRCGGAKMQQRAPTQGLQIPPKFGEKKTLSDPSRTLTPQESG